MYSLIRYFVTDCVINTGQLCSFQFVTACTLCKIVRSSRFVIYCLAGSLNKKWANNYKKACVQFESHFKNNPAKSWYYIKLCSS